MGSRLESNSNAVRKRIESHTFENEEGEEYEPSKFGGFPEYFRRKKIKLQNLDVELRSRTDAPPIFRGVVAHVNGYTQPSLNDLHRMIVTCGGGFMQYLDGKTTVTHVIASNLTPKKKVEFAKYRIVKPAWVVDSIDAGKLLPWNAYRLVDEGVGQRILGIDNGNVTSQNNTSQFGYRDQTDGSWYATHVKELADQLDTGEERHKRFEEAPSKAEGVNTENLENDSDPTFHINRRKHGGSANVDENFPDQHSESPVDEGTSTKSEKNDAADPILGDEVDPDLFPALNDSFTESTQNTQDKGSVIGLSSQAEQNWSAPEQSHPASAQMKIQRSDAARFGHSDARQHKTPLDSPDKVVTNIEDSAQEETNPLPIENLAEQALATEATSGKEMTAEEHNALLLADPRVWKSTVVNPAFLKQYYEESRLHHLSAWKASLKTQIQAMAAEKSSSQRAREKRPLGARRYILHVDFDSFFAAVSLKKHPEHADKPVVIAHGSGGGAEIASSNYPAREFGIKNGMWMSQAQRLCPNVKVLPYDFKAYEEASRHFYEAIIDTGGIVQSVSIDEALLDVSLQCIKADDCDGKGDREGNIWREQAKAADIAHDIRNRVKEKTGCVVSVGIGGNILLAKVALRKAKPAGQYHIKPEQALDFLGELAMQDLPGIAWSIGGKLEEIGVKFVRDVRALSRERMISVLGPKTGEKIWDYSRGIDRVEVGEQVIRKSVSAEVNWGIRFVTQEQAEEFIQSLCDELHKRLVNEGVKGRQLTMKIMRRAADAPVDPPKHLGHGKCDTFNKSAALGVATNDAQILGREAIAILRAWGFSPGELRGLGCQMQKLEPIKGLPESLQDSSQKRLQFKSASALKATTAGRDRYSEEIESPQKPRDPPPPHPAAAFAKNASPGKQSRNPLNTLGTQFVLPSQVDPATLEELPAGIRERLHRGREYPANDHESNTEIDMDTLPSESQLDQDTLNALPEDIRVQFVAQYHRQKNVGKQGVLPQSPRKDRTIMLPKKTITPTKKPGRLSGVPSKSTISNAAFSTLTQSNFVTADPSKESKSDGLDPITANDSSEFSAHFLSALPEDIRSEVLAQARRERLQKRGGIDVPASTSSWRRKQLQQQQQDIADLDPDQRTLDLAPLPAKPTFTSRRISALPDLRDAISAWYNEFRDEGPYGEDTEALVVYLGKVVGEEGDMVKAVAVGSWLKWLIEEGKEESVHIPAERTGVEGQRGKRTLGEDQITWLEAVERVERGIQEAVEMRGLGRVQI